MFRLAVASAAQEPPELLEYFRQPLPNQLAVVVILDTNEWGHLHQVLFVSTHLPNF